VYLVACASRISVSLEGRRHPVRRPDFKSGWGRQAVLGGFDSHALPPQTLRHPFGVIMTPPLDLGVPENAQADAYPVFFSLPLLTTLVRVSITLA
jgi:hypothetical protein